MTNARTGPPEKPGAPGNEEPILNPVRLVQPPDVLAVRVEWLRTALFQQKHGCAEHHRCLPPRVEGRWPWELLP
eukprot:9535103-Alexandrium_andersonii.AAC.1